MDDKPVYISGPKLRKRWDMPTSSFYYRLKTRAIPQPEFPFGAHTPFWRLSVIEEHERRATDAAKVAA